MSLVSIGRPITGGDFPRMPLRALDTLWLQVGGTLCNLECSHCFISSSPTNRSHEPMSLEEVEPFLKEAEALGVRDYYLTGGEPFLARDIFPIMEATLARGPTTVLTNGISIRSAEAEKLATLFAASAWSFDLRISIDGWDAATNDPIRGQGSFARILAGVRALAVVGLNPVITVTEACEGAASQAGRTRFLELLVAFGLEKPRLKVMPLLRIGAEVGRQRGYQDWESLAGAQLSDDELGALQCGHSRMVTSRGVYVCPILIDHEDARLSTTLAGSLVPFELAHRACFTCHAEGLSCAT